MKKDWLEEKLKEKLNDYPSPMDMEASWAALAARREEKKKRGFLFWFMGTAMVLVSGVALALSPALWQMEQPHELSFFPISSNGIAETTQLNLPLLKIDPAVNLPISTEAGSQQEATRLVVNDQEKEQLGQLNQNRGSSSTILTKINEEEVLEDQQVAIAPQQVSEIESPLNALNSLLLLPLSSQLIEKERLNALPLSAPLVRRRQSGGWWLGCSATAGTFQRQLKGGSEMDQALVDRRLVAEKTLDAWSFSLDIRKDFGQGFFIQGGLRHHFSYESFTDVYEKTYDKVLEDQLTQIIQRADGSTTEVRGDVTVEVKETTSNLIYNQQSLTEIPFILGIEVLKARKSGVNLSLGGIYGLIQRKDGQAFANTTGIGEYVSLQTLEYRSASIWGGQLQMDVFQEIAPQFQLFGGIQLKSYLNMAEQEAYFSERQNFLNLALGLRFRLP